MLQSTSVATALATLAALKVAAQPQLDLAPDIPTGEQLIVLEDLVSSLAFPSDVAVPPDGSPRLFVTEVSGRVRVVEGGALLTAPFLDFSAQGFTSNGSAMSGLAFHPDFADNRRMYVVMTENDGEPEGADFGLAAFMQQQSVLYEVRAQASYPDPGCNAIDPSATRELLRINEASTIHNLNDLAFGPDGYLYLAKGDDEAGGHVLATIDGSILRIDVDFGPGNGVSANGEYAIPADNPHVGGAGLDEIWANGFRNPWRIAFDGSELWVADVGANGLEEINRVLAGADCGWPYKEGAYASTPTGLSGDLSGLPPIAFVDPIAAYDHDQFDRSISGGVVYRGSLFPGLFGRYVFGDWISGRLFAADPASGAIERLQIDPNGDLINGQLGGPPFEGILAVRSDAQGELLVVATVRNDSPTGRVIRVGPPTWQDVGPGTAGAGGVPTLVGSGDLSPGGVGSLELSSAAPHALAGLFAATASAPLPLAGGLLLPDPSAGPLVAVLDSAGGLSLPFQLPPEAPAGGQLWVQWVIVDEGAGDGLVLSNALFGVID